MKDYDSVSEIDGRVLFVVGVTGSFVGGNGAYRCSVAELKAYAAACGLNDAGQEGFKEALKRARIADEQAAASREYLTRIMVELNAVTKNLTECQDLNTKQVLEIRELRTKNEELATQLHQAKLPPVEGTIFEDRDTWMKRALEAEAKYNALVNAVVPPFEWHMVCVGDGIDIHHVGVREYHAEIQRDKGTGRWIVGVWSFDIPIKTVFETTGYDLLELKRQVEDVITKTIIEGLCSST